MGRTNWGVRVKDKRRPLIGGEFASRSLPHVPYFKVWNLMQKNGDPRSRSVSRNRTGFTVDRREFFGLR